MTDYLALFREIHADAVSAHSAVSPEKEPNGTNGTNGSGIDLETAYAEAVARLTGVTFDADDWATLRMESAE